ncbi:hypothetical protein BLX88_00470 [Bacillus obstructivus]|nr:hypothetical protein BLX88_00470 [Bacillus obstructivus]
MAKKSRKVFATTATAALVASAVAPIASSAASFSDVTKPEYKTAIDALAEAGILNGYENGTFKPENKVTRGEVAKVITLIRHLEEGTKTPFKDVKDGYWSTQYINSLYAAKLVNGYEDGTFKPEGNVTRAEFAKLVVDAYGLTLTNAATPFTDVKAGNWATPYIQTAYANGLIKGVTASKFDPSAPIKRGDLAILLHRADAKFGDVIGNNFPGVELVKATNNTTVEVTFKNAVDAKDVQAAKFSIEGLTVSNAAVKQTDSKTVVLTTSAQEGGKLYTVKSGSATLGKFKGASAVIPTGVNVVEKSIQGVLGQEVTVKASVTVKDGESKAGIPVTFNITSSNQTLNAPQVVETTTDENGVATYSYTRYANSQDTVTVYATGDRTKFSTGTVYWAASKELTVEEVTTGNDLANKSKKVYKVVAKNKAGQHVLVAFKENVGVTPDKAVTDVTIENATVHNIDSNGKVLVTGGIANSYPQELTTGSKRVALVKIDNNGVGSFTLTGTNASVTPVVYEETTIYNGNNVEGYSNATLDGQERQVVAPTVKFSALQSLSLKVEAQGNQYAAAYGVVPTTTNATSDSNAQNVGGRNYTVTITDKNGKLASEGTQAYVTFEAGNYGKDVYVNGQKFTGTMIPIVVEGDKGQAVFRITGQKDGFATPTVFVNNGTDTAKLDKSDLQTVAETVFFKDADINQAKLTVTDLDTKKEVKELEVGKTAVFTYRTVDQNGFPYVKAGNANYDVTYQLTSQFADLTVSAGGKTLAGSNNTYTVPATNGVASIEVTTDVAQTVSAVVTGANGLLPLHNATVEFKAKASVLDRVNAATTAQAVLVALKDNSTYKAKLDTISPADQLTIATNILNKRPGAGYTQVQLDTQFTTEFEPFADKVAPTATATYSDAVTKVDEKAASASITVGSDKVLFTATKAGADYNDIKINLVNNKDNDTATEASLKVTGGVTTIEVELADNGTDVTSTYKEVIDAVNILKATSNIEASATTTAAADATAAEVNLTTAGGVTGKEAAPAKLTVTFSETIANPDDVNIAVPGKSLGANASYNWDTNKKVLTINLGSDATVAVGDVIKATGAKDASGNSQTGDITIQ